MTKAQKPLSPRAQQQIKYHLIFDTNAILGVKWSHGAIQDFKKSFEVDERLALELIAFKPVFEEWAKHFEEMVTVKLERHNVRAKQLNEQLSLKLPLTELTADEIKRRAEKYLGKIGFTVVEPNVSDFPTLEFFDRANKQLPPFHGEGKGFKDAVIATATVAYIKANPGLHYLILCDDSVHRKYLEEITRSLKNVKVVSGLDDAGSQLNLALSNLNEKLADIAKEKFSTNDDQAGIFYDLEIPKMLTELYHKKYPTGEDLAKSDVVTKTRPNVSTILLNQSYLIPNVSKWKPINTVFSTLDTTFIKKEGDKLYWESNAAITQSYRLEYGAVNALMSSPGTVEHTIIYSVSWTTDSSDSGDDFANPQLIGTPEEASDSVQYYPADSFNSSLSRLAAANSTISGTQTPEKQRYQSLLTLLGQDNLGIDGTAPSDFRSKYQYPALGDVNDGLDEIGFGGINKSD